MKKKISQKDAHKLLDLASHFIVTCRSWGYHLNNNPILKYRDADTGEVLPGWSGDKLENVIKSIRLKQKGNKCSQS